LGLWLSRSITAGQFFVRATSFSNEWLLGEWETSTERSSTQSELSERAFNSA
jgi:hypothetical protein